MAHTDWHALDGLPTRCCVLCLPPQETGALEPNLVVMLAEAAAKAAEHTILLHVIQEHKQQRRPASATSYASAAATTPPSSAAVAGGATASMRPGSRQDIAGAPPCSSPDVAAPLAEARSIAGLQPTNHATGNLMRAKKLKPIKVAVWQLEAMWYAVHAGQACQLPCPLQL